MESTKLDALLLVRRDLSQCLLTFACSWCVSGGEWVRPQMGHFDHIGSAVLLLFELSTGEGWPAQLCMLLRSFIHSSEPIHSIRLVACLIHPLIHSHAHAHTRRSDMLVEAPLHEDQAPVPFGYTYRAMFYVLFIILGTFLILGACACVCVFVMLHSQLV